MSQESFLSRALNYLLNHKKETTNNENRTDTKNQRHAEAERGSEAGHSASEGTPNASDSAKQQEVDESTASRQSASTADQQSLFTPANVMRALGVEILEDGDDGYYLVGFQGGAFVFYFDDDRLNVMYNDVVECSFTDSVKAAFVANDLNGEYSVWSCYMRASHRGTTEKPVKICFSQMFPLVGDFKKTTEFIHSVLVSAFTVGREFRAKYKHALEDDSNLANTLNKKDFMNKLELSKRLIEVGNFDEIQEEMPPTSYLRVDSLADLFDDTEFGAPLSLQIVADGQLEVVKDAAEVEQFDVRSYIRNHPKRDELENATIIAVFEKQNLVVNLKKMPGSNAKSLFFLLNVMRSGIESDLFARNQSAVSCRATVEIRLTTDQEDYWEVKYMIDDAKDKHAKNDISSLTEEQKMLLIQLTPNMQDDFYWGIKFFNESCWYQALYYFKRIFYNSCRQDAKHTRNGEIVADICLYLGITYYHLRMYDRAYYYLDRSRKYDSIIASQWYVNCLCSMKDPMAFTYVKKMLAEVAIDIEEPEGRLRQETENSIFEYYLFLKRKLAQIMITDWRLNQAEDFLKKMIEANENVDFAHQALDTIRKMRRKQLDEEVKEAEKNQHNSDQ